jgi:hypothetical protein
MTNKCPLHHYSFFLGESVGMATDIGSLAPGMGGHVFRLGIGRKGLRRTKEVLSFFLGTLTFPL